MQSSPSNLHSLTIKTIHFIGIGGTGMGGLAKCLRELDYTVSGSDMQANETTERLQALGITISIGHSKTNVPNACGLIVKSAAIPDNNPEMVEAIRRNIPVIKYAQLLGQLMQNKYGIAVSGSHGKTTASSLIAYTLEKAQYDPSFVIGGYIPDLKASARSGRSQYFVAEACEYDRSFHNLIPTIGIILNLEPDHLDYYDDMTKLIEAFGVFAGQIPTDSFLIANACDTNVKECLKSARCRIERFNTSTKSLPAEWTISNIKSGTMTTFDVLHNGQPYGTFNLRIPGRHNLNNALVTIIVSHILKIEQPITRQALSEFKGIDRRFELIGQFNNVTVLDDYAHHPTELAATIQTAQVTYPNKRIWFVFQPHQYSRTRMFLNEFASVFTPLKNVIIADIYPARDSDEEQKKVSARDLMNKINQSGGHAQHIPTLNKITDYIRTHAVPGDVVITMGAGDIFHVAHNLVKLSPVTSDNIPEV